MIFDFRAGGLRPLDWSLDLVSTSDILKLREVVLHCPDGNEGHLKIDEPGTAFQFKIATMHEGHAKRQTECQLIGKVTDKVSGACLCYIYDKVEGLIEYTSTIYNFGTWRTGILPLTALNCDVLGLRM